MILVKKKLWQIEFVCCEKSAAVTFYDSCKKYVEFLS